MLNEGDSSSSYSTPVMASLLQIRAAFSEGLVMHVDLRVGSCGGAFAFPFPLEGPGCAGVDVGVLNSSSGLLSLSPVA